MSLLDYDSLLHIVIFEDDDRFVGQLICETQDPDGLDNLDIPTRQSRDADADADELGKDDLRYSLVRSKHDLIRRLKNIQVIRKAASKYGLDKLVRKVIIHTISTERYNEINGYSDDDKINAALDKLEASGAMPGDRNSAKERLLLKAKLTTQEIFNLDKAFIEYIIPKIKERRESFAKLAHNDPHLGKILNTDLNTNIDIEYTDHTQQPAERVRDIIKATDPLAKRVDHFGKALASTDEHLGKMLTKRFAYAYKSILDRLRSVPDMAGSEHESQRIYTATLFALHYTAPLLNLTNIETRQQEVAKQADEKKKQDEKVQNDKKKEEEAKKKEEEAQQRKVEALRKQAEKSYKHAVKAAVAASNQETRKAVEAHVSKFFGRPISTEDALQWFELNPSLEYKKWITYIKKSLGIPDREQLHPQPTPQQAPDPSTLPTPDVHPGAVLSQASQDDPNAILSDEEIADILKNASKALGSD